MSRIRSMLPLFSLLALQATARATVTDHYTFLTDSTQSQVQYHIDTTLGPCTLSPSMNGKVDGDMVLVLHPGTFPISDGRYDGGSCACHPDLVGIVPNSLPGLPPLLECHLSNLVVSPHSQPFQCDANGLFLVDTNCDVTSGNLDVSVMGGSFLPVPIVGLTSDSTRSHGQVWIDGNGIHVVRELGNTIDVSVPALGIGLQISIRGSLHGNMAYPPPTTFCPATPNSTGAAARISFGGTPSISRNDGQLLVTSCPQNTTGYFFAGDVQGQVPFGNGVRCVAGQLLRLGTLHLGTSGAGFIALDVHVPPAAGSVVAGSRWNFQFAYRDVAAGGAMFNASDAVAVDFVP